MYHIYIIINTEKEKDRLMHLQKQLLEHELSNITLFCKFWKTDITENFINKYKCSEKLNNGEISLFLNHIECLKEIKSKYSDGIFIILESDVIFLDNFKNNIEEIIESSKGLKEWDIINIGAGNVGNKYKKVSKMKEKNVINNIKFVKTNINRCAEALIWNYNSICKFIDIFEKDPIIRNPIDVAYNILNIYWTIPYICEQGSFKRIFDSHLRKPKVNNVK